MHSILLYVAGLDILQLTLFLNLSSVAMERRDTLLDCFDNVRLSRHP